MEDSVELTAKLPVIAAFIYRYEIFRRDEEAKI